MTLARTYGHRNGDRIRMPTLMPEMYALAGCGHLPYVILPSTSSTAIAVTIATNVRS
jgi:hypothetical protein